MMNIYTDLFVNEMTKMYVWWNALLWHVTITKYLIVVDKSIVINWLNIVMSHEKGQEMNCAWWDEVPYFVTVEFVLICSMSYFWSSYSLVYSL